MDNQRCTQCPAVLPISKFSKHVETKHGDLKDTGDSWKSGEELDIGENDMDYDLDDEDVKAFHDKIGDSPSSIVDMDTNQMDKEGVDRDQQRALCPMCSSLVGVHVLTRHLATEHYIRVVSAPDWADICEDPFAVPDFLASKKKEKCHHCQTEFHSRKELNNHIEESHDNNCRVCRVQKLVQDRRSVCKIKPTSTNTERNTPYQGSIISGEVEEVMSHYSDFYPPVPVESCEECESEFCWAGPQHSCSLTAAGVRIVAGQRLQGRMITGETRETPEKQLRYLPSHLAQSLVEEKAQTVEWEERREISAEIEILLEDLIDNLVEGWAGLAQSIEEREDQLSRADYQCQLSGQIMCYRYLQRRETIPDVALRAAHHPQLVTGSLNDRRKLNSFMFEEYKEDIEELRKDEFLKRSEKKKQLKKEALREMNRIKTYDYSRYYNIPNIQASKKPKIQVKHSVGPAIDLNRTNPGNVVKLVNGNSVLKTVVTPTRISQQSSRPPAKMGRMIKLSSEGVESIAQQPEQRPRKMPPGPPIEPLQTHSTPKPMTTLERLQSRGISVSVTGTTPVERPLQNSPSEFQKAPPIPRTMIVKKIVKAPSMIAKKIVRAPSMIVKKIVKAPTVLPGDRKIQIPNVGQKSRIQHKTQSKPHTKPAASINKVNQKMSPGGILSNQKLLLKSQILAYRMMRRKENIPKIVMLAATKINFKELELSKNDKRSLQHYFSAEYSSL